MNTYNIALASTGTEYTQYLPEIILDDCTTVSVTLSGVSETSLPLSIAIDWGDGSPQPTVNSSYFISYRNQSILNEVLYGRLSNILATTYIHTYVPSVSALYKSATAQIILKYVNGDTTAFYIPFNIRSAEYYESILDMSLVNTEIVSLTSNNKQFTFATDTGYIIESVS